ncbi:haloacid dehalogenase type II [Mycobacterium sp. 3519A]|uniref:haloacid dehalogenase type II n=1 Tax=Mycobacterium sp. 3519A TaxID=2057184 RepID=UPI000C7A257B|nr:haloacid dehalogenase type II [Mycobacterium sp. 3519A]
MSAHPVGSPSDGSVRTLIFDVNETLLDIESLIPHFERVFGDGASMRTWFGELVMYSMTITLSGYYVDFFNLGRAVLQMMATIRGTELRDTDLRALEDAMRTMPAHPDVAPALERLRDEGYHLVTLTNSPHRDAQPSPLDNSGLGTFFEQQYTVDSTHQFKPSTLLYRRVAADLGVTPAQCMMVAAHTWDVIGGLGAGMRSALITRPGNAPLLAPGLPQPDLVSADLGELAQQLATTRL